MQKRLHKAWMILIICCLSQGAAIGIAANCAGLFFEPVSKELGCSMASISLFMTVISISQFASTSLFVKKAFFKFKAKYVMFAAAVILSLRGLLAFSVSVWQWWLMVAVTGIGSSLLNGFATSIVLERWFTKRFPTALSLMATFSGMFGIVMSMVIGHLIQGLGWRSAILITHAILLILEVPTLFIVLNPCEVNAIPYGSTPQLYEQQLKELQSKPDEKTNTTVRIPFSGKMVIVLILGILNTTYSSFIAHLSPLGYSMNVPFNPSLIVTLNMAGNMFFKLIFGPLVERKGLRVSSVFILCMNLIGCILLLTGQGNTLLVGAFFFGACALVYTSMVPLIERFFYSSAEYPAILQIQLAVYAIFYASFSYLYGLIRDLTGSYKPGILLMICSSVLNIFILFFALKKKEPDVQVS